MNETATTTRPSPGQRFPPLAVAVFGVVTIVAYGVAYYAYGVLIDPIRSATGWSQAGLGAVFSVALVVGGIGGLAGGRLVDRLGTRPAFGLAGTIGAGALFAAAYAHSLPVFGVLYAVGCGVIAALGFYHVTQPAAIRHSPEAPARAVVWLTILGALASPIFLPLTAGLVDAVGWRATIRVEAGMGAVVLIIAAALAGPRRSHHARSSGPDTVRQAMARAWRVPGFRPWVVASLISGAAVDVILVYQVPIMIAGGLPIGAAATIGGLRGFAQLGGRLPLTPVLRRAGTRRAILLTFVCAAAGALCLLLAGHTAGAVAFAVLAGASIGAIYTLQGIYTNELVGDANLSLLMGAQQAIFAGGGAAGPVVAGATAAVSGSYTIVVVLTALGFVGAAAIIAAGAAPSADCC